MSLQRTIPPKTIEAQRNASDPNASAWVSANAGSGKTHVLTQRVVRLLLEGTPPSKILCLTYTKAAAANMSLRVFETLAKWTMLDDATLASAIAATGAQFKQQDLRFARRLFARTVETPGGLKIQTIHAFCERLLHLFPFEANLPSRFQLVDDAQKDELRSQAREAALGAAIANPQSAAGEALIILAATTSASGFDALLREALSRQRDFAAAIRCAGTLDACSSYLARRLGLARGESLAEIERAMIEGGIRPPQWPALVESLMKGSANDQALAKHCQRAINADGAARTEAWLDIFFTKERTPRASGAKSIITKKLKDLEPNLLSQLEEEQVRLVSLLEKRRAATIVQNTAALMTLADCIFQSYREMKNTRGLLDFDDLIDKTLNLLTRSDAGWVLFKLDSGIDHILIDEAQDTSPEQWDILRLLAEEFTSGKGQRTVRRTFFAVGDEKQSIYSFQGAKPDKFDEMRRLFHAKTTAAEGVFNNEKLLLSFRSARVVLEAVDAIFRAPENRRGLSSDDDIQLFHEPLKNNVPGLIEVWEPVAPEPSPPPRDWRLPLDYPDPHDPQVIVARNVAELVASWLKPGSVERVIDSETNASRPIRAGDVIVLVRTRSAFFNSVIRAFKDKGVPVAGADRLKFTQHIAVMDLIAAGRASLLPSDDLTLACLMKSPLMGLDDDDLIALAPNRKGALIDALEASGDARHRRASERLAKWRDRARHVTPFMFYTHLLGADGGRSDLIARLGSEASDAIDELLSQALKHEQKGAPSLPAFLATLESADSDVKRDMDSAADTVRVMTVHGAKGLEAKIVILPDTCTLPTQRHDPKIFAVKDREGAIALAWSPRKTEDAAPIAEARALAQQAAQDEYRRLLYVALTRAEERLYIMGYQNADKAPDGCWYNMIRSALEPQLAAAPSFDEKQTVWRHADEGVRDVADEGRPVATKAPPPVLIPEWLSRAAPAERDEAPPVRPSNALAAVDQTDVPNDDFDRHAGVEAARLGRLMHGLLQHLPLLGSQNREEAARRYLAMRAPGLEERQRAVLFQQASAVLTHPALVPLFGPGSQAEVSIAGQVEIASGRSINIIGQIDRLMVSATEVLIADFKTGRPRPRNETPMAYAVQLALYQAALAEIYPNRKLRALLVWVNGLGIVEFSNADMQRALAAIGKGQGDAIGLLGA